MCQAFLEGSVLQYFEFVDYVKRFIYRHVILRSSFNRTVYAYMVMKTLSQSYDSDASISKEWCV